MYFCYILAALAPHLRNSLPVDSIAASLFVLNWLSWQIVMTDDRWQDPNNNTDTETRCLVYLPVQSPSFQVEPKNITKIGCCRAKFLHIHDSGAFNTISISYQKSKLAVTLYWGAAPILPSVRHPCGTQSALSAASSHPKLKSIFSDKFRGLGGF